MLICVRISSYESKRILKYCFEDDFFHIIFQEHLVLLGELYRGKHALASMHVTDKSQYELLSSSSIFIFSLHLHSPSEASQALNFHSKPCSIVRPKEVQGLWKAGHTGIPPIKPLQLTFLLLGLVHAELTTGAERLKSRFQKMSLEPY